MRNLHVRPEVQPEDFNTINPHTALTHESVTKYLQVRTVNALCHAFMKLNDPQYHWVVGAFAPPTVGTICALTDQQVLSVKNAGVKTLDDVKELRKLVDTRPDKRSMELGERMGLSRAQSRPGDGDMGG